MKLQGVFVAAATPFDHTGALYAVKVQHNVEKWSRTAVSGFLFGSLTGEGALLGDEERETLFKLALPHIGEGRIAIADVTAEGTHTAARLAQAAANAGAQAAICLPPHRYRNLMYAPESQALFFRVLADRSPIPILMHNAPLWTGVDLGVETVTKLSNHPNIIGVLETGTPVERIAQLRSSLPKEFHVLAGTESQTLESLQAGANGMALAIASAVPYAAIALWEAYRTRDFDAAKDWQKRIAHPSVLVTDMYGVPGLKYAMDLHGYYGGPPRLPFMPIQGASRSQVSEAFEIFHGC